MEPFEVRVWWPDQSENLPMVRILKGPLGINALGLLRQSRNAHIPSDLVVEHVTAHWKPPEVRIWRLRNQSRVGTLPPSTSTPHRLACLARHW